MPKLRPPTPMLDRLRGCKNEHAAYVNFLAELERRGVFTAQKVDTPIVDTATVQGDPVVVTIERGGRLERDPRTHEQLADLVLGIDRAALDDERRALIDWVDRNEDYTP